MTNEITINDEAQPALRDLTIKDWAEVVGAGLLFGGLMVFFISRVAGFSSDSVFYECGQLAAMLTMKVPMGVGAGLAVAICVLTMHTNRHWLLAIAALAIAITMVLPFIGVMTNMIPLEACVAAAEASGAASWTYR